MRRALLAVAALGLSACTSTSSVVLAPATVGAPKLAILPLDGPLGEQASDLLAQEFASHGITVVERGKTLPSLAVDTGGAGSASPATVQSYARLGDQLGVRYLFTGTISAAGGPLFSYAHVDMTLRLIDVRSGETRWIGRYGNSPWSTAISTQGDLHRGSRDLVDEFVKAGGEKLLHD